MSLINQKFRIKKSDKKRYVFVEKRDYEILSKVYQLEKFNLTRNDKDLIKFIRTQLKKDWRSPVIKVLNRLLKKYNK